MTRMTKEELADAKHLEYLRCRLLWAQRNRPEHEDTQQLIRSLANEEREAAGRARFAAAHGVHRYRMTDSNIARLMRSGDRAMWETAKKDLAREWGKYQIPAYHEFRGAKRKFR
jgi:hypothetical protein